MNHLCNDGYGRLCASSLTHMDHCRSWDTFVVYDFEQCHALAKTWATWYLCFPVLAVWELCSYWGKKQWRGVKFQYRCSNLRLGGCRQARRYMQGSANCIQIPVGVVLRLFSSLTTLIESPTWPRNVIRVKTESCLYAYWVPYGFIKFAFTLIKFALYAY